jgi:hypothetical protein
MNAVATTQMNSMFQLLKVQYPKQRMNTIDTLSCALKLKRMRTPGLSY